MCNPLQTTAEWPRLSCRNEIQSPNDCCPFRQVSKSIARGISFINSWMAEERADPDVRDEYQSRATAVRLCPCPRRIPGKNLISCIACRKGPLPQTFSRRNSPVDSRLGSLSAKQRSRNHDCLMMNAAWIAFLNTVDVLALLCSGTAAYFHITKKL